MDLNKEDIPLLLEKINAILQKVSFMEEAILEALQEEETDNPEDSKECEKSEESCEE